MLGFELDFWDYATFATLAIAGAAFIVLLMWFAGLPGRIALARKHPEAEAVNLMAYIGLLPTIYPWVQAFIWAFKPTEIIDIRRWPEEERRAVDAELARLSGKAGPDVAAATPSPPEHAAPPSASRDAAAGALPPAGRIGN